MIDDHSYPDYDLFLWRAAANLSTDISNWYWTPLDVSGQPDSGDDANVTFAGFGSRWVTVWQSNRDLRAPPEQGPRSKSNFDILFSTSIGNFLKKDILSVKGFFSF